MLPPCFQLPLEDKLCTAMLACLLPSHTLWVVSLERMLSPFNLRRPLATSSKTVSDGRLDCRLRLCANGSGAAWAALARGANFRPTVGRVRTPQRSLFLSTPPSLPSHSSTAGCSILLTFPFLPPSHWDLSRPSTRDLILPFPNLHLIFSPLSTSSFSLPLCLPLPLGVTLLVTLPLCPTRRCLELIGSDFNTNTSHIKNRTSTRRQRKHLHSL